MVTHASVQLVLYALLAAVSPLAFAATLAVMQTSRLRALAFAVGFVAAQLFTCGVFVAVGVAATGASSLSRPGLAATLDIAVAGAALVVAFRLRRSPPKPRPGSSERSKAILERLGQIRVVTGLVAGLLLGIGGPKRLVLTALAATAITTAGVAHDAGQAGLVVLYGTVATVLVWAPIAAFVLVGERMVEAMRQAQRAVAARQREVSFYALLVIAAVLILDAFTLLLG